MSAPIDTKETPGPLDAFETLKPGEPHYTIQGGDPLAPGTLLHWAKEARILAFQLQDEDKDEKARDLLLRASATELIAWQMQAYQRGWTEQHEHDQSAHEGESEQDAAWRMEHFNLRSHTITRLHNAVAEANDQLDNLGKLELDYQLNSEVYLGIKQAVALLKKAAFKLEPKRKVERI